MNHTSLGISDGAGESAAVETIWETSNVEHPTPNIEGGKEDMAAVVPPRRDCYLEAEAAREDVRPTMHPIAHDSVKASQARSDFIKATIIFFGLDSDCPSESGNLSA